jgi:murein DD-endopeptidase MepM/ murein hydrolase activator NlpD
MLPKKTLSERLTNKYHLIIRNEENLAEKTSFGFTYAKLLVFSITALVLIFAFSLFLAQTLLARWFDPRHAQREANQQLYRLALKVDSLTLDVERKDQFIRNFQRVLNGDTAAGFSDPAAVLADASRPVKVGRLGLTGQDSAFRDEFERSDLNNVTFTQTSYSELQKTFLFTPLNGMVSDRFDLKKGHHGVDIVSKTNEPVKCVADGTVVLASWTQDSGYVIAVQHAGNLLSVYKHNAELLKKVGNFINAGEIISIVGNSGEMTSGPHLHFELWYNGNPLNPEEFVTF